VSNEAKIFKELICFGFSRCFLVKIEQSSKISQKMPLLGRFFEVYSIMTEKQQLKPKNSSSSIFLLQLTPCLTPGARQ